MGLLPSQIQAGLNNFLNSALPAGIGNPDLAGIASNALVQSKLENDIRRGNLPPEDAARASATIAHAQGGGPLDMSHSTNILKSVVSSQFRNADGTPNGKMDPALLGMMDSVVDGLTTTGTTPTLGTSATTVIGAAAERVFYEWGKRDANVGRVLSAGVLPVGAIIDRLLQGDFVGALNTTLFGGVFDHLQGPYHNWRVSNDPNDLRLRVPVVDAYGQVVYLSSKLDKWPKNPVASSSILGEDHIGNVGHMGHMTATLGGLRFELPPAVGTVTPVPGGTGQVTPGAQAGIQFNHVQNIVPMLVPGSFPAYQSLGISGHVVEFVGLFLGYDHTDTGFLNSDLHKPGWYDPQNPDPMYLGDDTKKGGAMAVSRSFLKMIQSGQPQTFEIFTGITRIRYELLITQFPRAYQRDDRVYYRIVGFAIGGGESAATSKQSSAPARKSVPDKRGAAKRASAPRPKTNRTTSASTPTRTPSRTAANSEAKSDEQKPPVVKSTPIAANPRNLTDLGVAVRDFESAVDKYVSLVNNSAPFNGDTFGSQAAGLIGRVVTLGQGGIKKPKVKKAILSSIRQTESRITGQSGTVDSMLNRELTVARSANSAASSQTRLPAGAGGSHDDLRSAAGRQVLEIENYKIRVTKAYARFDERRQYVNGYVRETGGAE